MGAAVKEPMGSEPYRPRFEGEEDFEGRHWGCPELAVELLGPRPG
jgi:hypothetical protein